MSIYRARQSSIRAANATPPPPAAAECHCRRRRRIRQVCSSGSSRALERARAN